MEADPVEGVDDGLELEGADPELDQFSERLIETMTIPIDDKQSASSVVPFVMRVPYDYADRVTHLDLAKAGSDEAREERRELLERIAMSMDAEPEELLGVGNSTYANGRIVTGQS